MGYLEKRSDGYYVLHIEYGGVTINKIFKEVHIPLESVSDIPDHEGFRFYIPAVSEKDYPVLKDMGWTEKL